MQIKVTNNPEAEAAIVELINPSTGEQAAVRQLEAGDSITLTATDVHEAEGIEIGEIESTPQGE